MVIVQDLNRGGLAIDEYLSAIGSIEHCDRNKVVLGLDWLMAGPFFAYYAAINGAAYEFLQMLEDGVIYCIRKTPSSND